ncbi:hypothetical protein [Streptomyces sp. XY431]|uniref:hypothetical protein n=1 Tax=Streptomyces sp. XY431 TaxID=1415562 RepID=UPI000AB1381A|nr:hypothetical protein [Streptomyces sp. XY431]
MKSPVGTYELSGGAVLRVFADPGHSDGYGLEITHNGESVRYDGGHTAREVHAFMNLFT